MCSLITCVLYWFNTPKVRAADPANLVVVLIRFCRYIPGIYSTVFIARVAVGHGVLARSEAVLSTLRHPPHPGPILIRFHTNCIQRYMCPRGQTQQWNSRVYDTYVLHRVHSQNVSAQKIFSNFSPAPKYIFLRIESAVSKITLINFRPILMRSDPQSVGKVPFSSFAYSVFDQCLTRKCLENESFSRHSKSDVSRRSVILCSYLRLFTASPGVQLQEITVSTLSIQLGKLR